MAQPEPYEPTPEDQAELARQPPGQAWMDLTPEQVRLRQEMGQRMCSHFNRADDTMDDDIRAAYEEKPMWGFYVDAVSGLPKRIYGMCQGADGEWSAHTSSAMLMFNNLTVGGTPLAALTRVDAWSPAHIDRFRMTPNPGLFLDPLGFILLIHDANSRRAPSTWHHI